MTPVITSASNPKIKRLLSLQQKSSERRESGLFVVEGRRELGHCTAAGFELESVFVCPEIAGDFTLPACGAVFEVSPQVYSRIACRQGTEGVVAEVRTRNLTLADLALGDRPLVAVMESVEKPGNIGASCAAAMRPAWTP